MQNQISTENIVEATRSGLPRLSRQYNRGYTRAIQDLQEVYIYIQPDLKHHHKNLNGKLAVSLLQCCLKNRERIREGRNGLIRYNGQKKDFEWFDQEE